MEQLPHTGTVTTKEGTNFTITVLSKTKYVFYAFNRKLEHTADMDLVAEFGDDGDAWGEYITEEMQDAGVILYSEVLECWCPSECVEEWEREAAQEAEWENDHIRQERRSDIFI